jgi:hypothetical protein
VRVAGRTAWQWVISTLLLAAGSSALLVWLSGLWWAARQQGEGEGDAAAAGVGAVAGGGSAGLSLVLLGALVVAACSR